ncbi:MAG TPA: hypothetical protein VHB50_17880, partial [Bryobacteraceae bacterium]|nr:hypothetical protein [Bryobacteraceae bacterium]
TRNITIDLGVRYEFTSLPYGEKQQSVNNLASVPGLISFGEPKPQRTNWAPRVGVAWSPDSNTSVRAGFGMAYDVLYDNLGILSSPPQFSQTVDLTCAASNPWQCGPGFLAGGGIKPSASAGTLSAADARAGTSAYVPDQVLPYSINWNLSVQRSFAKDYTLSVSYVGTRGVHLPTQVRLDQEAIVQPGHSLPTYLSNPGQAALDALPLTLETLQAQFKATKTPNASGGIPLSYYNAGFQSQITAFMPWSNSHYNGLSAQLDRRFAAGLTFRAAYTWSHNIDDATATAFTTVFSPRRPEDFGNLSLDRANSILDHRQRFTIATYYDLPLFAHSQNYLLKNVVGNWVAAPVYTYQTPEFYVVQSNVDSNLNGDTASDRTVYNPNGVTGTSSLVKPLYNSAGATVAYIANNANAQYIQAGAGVLPNVGRNTLAGRPTNDLDLTLAKRISFGERLKFEFQAQFLNSLNHPQYLPGSINDVQLGTYTSSAVRNMLITGQKNFNRPDQVLSSNPRTIQLTAKFRF